MASNRANRLHSEVQKVAVLDRFASPNQAHIFPSHEQSESAGGREARELKISLTTPSFSHPHHQIPKQTTSRDSVRFFLCVRKDLRWWAQKHTLRT